MLYKLQDGQWALSKRSGKEDLTNENYSGGMEVETTSAEAVTESEIEE